MFACLFIIKIEGNVKCIIISHLWFGYFQNFTTKFLGTWEIAVSRYDKNLWKNPRCEIYQIWILIFESRSNPWNFLLPTPTSKCKYLFFETWIEFQIIELKITYKTVFTLIKNSRDRELASYFKYQSCGNEKINIHRNYVGIRPIPSCILLLLIWVK